MHPLILQLLIPEQWKEVLSSVKEFFPNAIIAGGSLRDLDYERPIKDVDIFIESALDTDFNKIQRAFVRGRYKINPPKLSPTSMEEYTLSEEELKKQKDSIEKSKQQILKEQRKIFCIYQTQTNEYSYEFIFGCKDTCNVDKFDLSFCQISYDGQKIYKSDHYKQTEESGIVKVIYNDRADGQIGRIERFKDKYSDLTFELLKN